MKTPGQIVKSKRTELKMEKAALAKKLDIRDSFIGHIERDGVPISERLTALLQKHLKLDKSFPKLVAAHNVQVNAKLSKMRKARKEKANASTAKPAPKPTKSVSPTKTDNGVAPKNTVNPENVLNNSELNHAFEQAMKALADRIKRDENMIAKLDAIIRENGGAK